MVQGKIKFLISLSLVLIIAFTIIGPVLANELQERQAELREIQEGIQEAARQRQELESNVRRLQAELEELDRELADNKRRVNEINNQIRDTEVTIQVKEKEIEETEAHLEEQTSYLETRMRAIYKRGNVGYLEVLFSATNFSDFISRFNFLRTMIEDDLRLVEEIKEKKEFLEFEREEQVRRKESLVVLRREALDIQTQTERKIAEQNNIARQMNQEMNNLASYIEQMEQAHREAEAEIARMEEEIRRRQNQGGTGQTTGTYIWPVQEFGYAWITSRFGPRWGGMHRGIDIGIPHNRWPVSPTFIGRPANVVAADGGEVIIVVGREGAPTDRGFLGSREGGGFGRYVAIFHDNGHVTIYAHLHDVFVTVGQQVARGEVIGTVGSTGNSTGPHLHFEIRVNGERVNPLLFY